MSTHQANSIDTNRRLADDRWPPAWPATKDLIRQVVSQTGVRVREGAKKGKACPSAHAETPCRKYSVVVKKFR